MKTVAFIFFLFTCLTSASKAQQKKMDLAERWRDKPKTIIITSFDSAYYWNQKNIRRQGGSFYAELDTLHQVQVLMLGERLGCEDTLCYRLNSVADGSVFLDITTEMMRPPFSVAIYKIDADNSLYAQSGLPKLERWKYGVHHSYRPVPIGSLILETNEECTTEAVSFETNCFKGAEMLYVMVSSRYTWVHGYVRLP
jgi:hypothetical protein